MTLCKDLMPNSNEKINVCGCNLNILWSTFKNWTPYNLTIVNFGHPVSTSLLIPWIPPIYKYDIPVGCTPGITSPREDCPGPGVESFPGAHPTGMSYLFYHTKQNTKHKRGKNYKQRFWIHTRLPCGPSFTVCANQLAHAVAVS